MDEKGMDVIEWNVFQACAEVAGEFVCSWYATWAWPETGEQTQCMGDGSEDVERRMRLAWWKRYGDRVLTGRDLSTDGED